ncbi:MAG: acyl-CoA-binding protein [Casimicrobiaceae bacterium]
MTTAAPAPASKAAVLMIHGLGGTQYDLGSMHKILQRAGFTTHSLTLPGHGTTPEDLMEVKAEDWIEAVQTLYRELVDKYETLHVCGMCMGALLSIELVKRERHTKGKLVALAPPIHIDGWATPWYVGLRRYLYWIPALRKMKVEEEDPFGIKNELIRNIVKAKFARGEAFHYQWVPLACVEQVDRLRAWVMAGLDQITCSTLVCHAREDELTSPRSAAFLEQEIGKERTQVVLLDNSYHMICVDNDRDLVARRVLEHFGADVEAAMAPRRPTDEGPKMTLEALQKLADDYFGALKSQQYEALIRVLASDVLWHEPGTSALSGDHAGRSQLVQFFSTLMELSDGTLAFDEIGAVSVTDRLASAPLRFSAKRAGRTFSGNATMVIRGAEGRVAEVWNFAADIAAVDAFWRGEDAPVKTTAAAASPAAKSAAGAAPVDLENGELDARFQRAADASRTLPDRPDSATLLNLYALYKQAGSGDVAGERPGLTDPVGRAKFDAWEKLRGVGVEQAKIDYIALVRTLLAG